MFGAPAAVDNDANAAALAEQRVGVARDERVVVMLTLGTGIGCGIVIDGRPLRGAFGGAGELGHVPLGKAGVPCRCGIQDCVEPEASGSGLARAAREHGLGDLDAAGVFARAAAGDDVAGELVTRFIDRLGAVVGTVVNVLNPNVVVIGGGVSNAGDALFTPLRATVERYALATHRAGLRLVPPMLGERAGSVGAGLLGWGALAGG
jgi:glucokinase